MAYYVTFSPDVRFDRIQTAAGTIIWSLYEAAQALKHNLNVTAGTNGHKPPSRHVTGEALDVQVRGLPPQLSADLFRYLRQKLGGLFYVSLEAPTGRADDAELQALIHDPAIAPLLTFNPDATWLHVHIQPVRGSVYPPPVATTTINA